MLGSGFPLALGARPRWFESSHPDHCPKTIPSTNVVGNATILSGGRQQPARGPACWPMPLYKTTESLEHRAEHAAWTNFRQACLNPKARTYRNYGAKGVTVAPVWSAFGQFLRDVGPRPSERHVLRRTSDPDGNYEPGNVAWTTDRRVKYRDLDVAGKFRSEYHIWLEMRSRCLSPSDSAYENYGGRGITICPEWLEQFGAFLEHIGRRPSAAHSVDRINNDGNYEPGNVRWATRVQQAQNRRPRRLGTKRVHGAAQSSRFVGVYFSQRNGKWCAVIHKKYIGLFVDEVDAATAYNLAAAMQSRRVGSLNTPTGVISCQC